MNSSVKVRPLARADYEQWLPLWAGYNEFYGRVGPTALAPEVTAATWSRFFDAYEPLHALVAEYEGRVVGLVHYLYHRDTISITPLCYLADLFTDASVRGKGVARALIEAVCQAARDAGIGQVYWLTHETNGTARKLYDKVADCPGFIVYGKNA